MFCFVITASKHGEITVSCDTQSRLLFGKLEYFSEWRSISFLLSSILFEVF